MLDAAATWRMTLSGIQLVEASAGTGKTWTIGNLYLRFVLEGRPVRELLVVTFTNAATEELRGRIRARLVEALAVLQDGSAGSDEFLKLLAQRRDAMPEHELRRAQARLQLAVRSMDEAAIHTIHGFCQRLLTEHGVYLGEPGVRELITDDDALWQSALRDWWRRLTYEVDEATLEAVMGAVGGFEQLVELQRPLRPARPVRLLPEVDQSPGELLRDRGALRVALDALAAAWSRDGERLKTLLLETKDLARRQDGDYLEAHLAEVFERLDLYFDGGARGPLPPELDLLSTDRLLAGSKPSRRGTDPGLRDPFFVACQELVEERQELRARLRVSLLRDATDFARRELERIKQAGRLFAFDDLLEAVWRALHGQDAQVLAATLRRRFPVALIDEFQDTDPIQYGIFRALYAGATDTCLILIGDPKQAIYSFRGADVFTYARARQDAGAARHTLDRNRRSTTPLIQAVNALFEGAAAPFVHEDFIAFEPARPAPDEAVDRLNVAGEPVAPWTLWQLGASATDKAPSKEVARAQVHARVADEICGLIRGGRAGTHRLGSRPVVPADIAVLVRRGEDGVAVRRELQARGVNSVSIGREGVFASSEAAGLWRLLAAVAAPKDRRALRAALASSLFLHEPAELVAAIEQESAWLAWIAALGEFHRYWCERGFMPMFQLLLRRHLGPAISRSADAERRLTNLLHLAELLQEASRSRPGPEALLAWFKEQRTNGPNQAELRLESDEDLVRILTIHSSKGLEFPIVFVPHLWDRRPPLGRQTDFFFHDETQALCRDLGSADQRANLRELERETLAENLRLLYVALTRARSKLYACWGLVGRDYKDTRGTAFGYLLAGGEGGVAETEPDTDELALSRLVDGAGGAIERMRLEPAAPAGAPLTLETPAPVLRAAKFVRLPGLDWRIDSFTGLTRGIHQGSWRPAERLGDPVLDFPAGSEVGTFLHLLLERLDYQADPEAAAPALIDRHAARFGLDPRQHQPTLIAWLRDILGTRLDEAGLRLASLPAARRLHELAFDFAADRVSIPGLERTLTAAAGRPLPALAARDFGGLVTGLIDLVFEHEGRYFIADFKSNHLGGRLDDYAPANLQATMAERRYDLQLLLYALALHRFLGVRLKDYRYETRFGGVYYLFLRGLRPSLGPARGVWFERPPESLIETLDQRIFKFQEQP